MRDIPLHVGPQALEGGVVGTVSPELGNRRERFFVRDIALKEVGPDDECREIVASCLAGAEELELGWLGAGVEQRGGGGQFLFIDAAEDGVGGAELAEEFSNDLDDSLAVDLLGNSFPGLRHEGSRGETGGGGGIEDEVERVAIVLQLGERVTFLR